MYSELPNESECFKYKDRLAVQYSKEFDYCLGEQAIKQLDITLCEEAVDYNACIIMAAGNSKQLCLDNGGIWNYEGNSYERCKLPQDLDEDLCVSMGGKIGGERCKIETLLK